TKYRVPSGATAGFCPSFCTRMDVLSPSTANFSMRKPLSEGGDRYNHFPSEDQHAQPPPGETRRRFVPSGSITQPSTFQPVFPRLTNEMCLPSGDHTGTPTATTGSCSNVTWRLCPVSTFNTHRLPWPPLSLR